MGAIKLFCLQSLLGIHCVILAGLMVIAVLAGVFPVLVVCDNGDYWTCMKAGALFFSVISGSALASVGLAILALWRPGVMSRAFLMIYSASLVVFRILGYRSFSAWHSGLSLMAALGVWTFVCVMFLGAGRDPIERRPQIP